MPSQPQQLKWFLESYAEDHPHLPRPALRLTWQICEDCRGEGTRGNPAFDGTSTEWWLEGDPSGEDLEEYLHGTRYDVACEECGGHGKVKLLDPDESDPQLLKDWDDWMNGVYESYREQEMERRMGA